MARSLETDTGFDLDVLGETLFGVRRDRYETDACYRERLMAIVTNVGRGPVQARSKICKCGIARQDCEYHR